VIHNTCQPERFKDEYRTHYKALYKYPVYLLTHLLPVHPSLRRCCSRSVWFDSAPTMKKGISKEPSGLAEAGGLNPGIYTELHHLWRGGATRKVFGLAISRSRVQILLEATLRNNLGQVVYTYVPLSPSSITWYRPKGGDALRPGR